MKKIPYIKPIIILAVCVVLVLPASYFGLFVLFGAGRTQCYPLTEFFTSYDNAPENTVGIEPLIKLAEDDESYLPTDMETKIARYSDDGYVSLSHHYAYCDRDGTAYEIIPKDKYMNAAMLMEQYGAFKAAYVDENGNILGVTKAARIHWGRDGTPRLKANGDRLAYFTGTMADWQDAVLIVLLFSEPAAVLALAVFIVLSAVSAAKKKHERSVS